MDINILLIITLTAGLVFNIGNLILSYKHGNSDAVGGWGCASLLSFGWLITEISNYYLN